MPSYGGGVQSMMGVTGAQRASADAKTTIDINPRLDVRSKSVVARERRVIQGSTLSYFYLLGQFGFLTSGLMMGMVLLANREPDSDLNVDKLIMAPTESRLLPGKKRRHIVKVRSYCMRSRFHLRLYGFARLLGFRTRTQKIVRLSWAPQPPT